MSNRVLKVLEGAFEYVVGEEGAEVTDVCVVVHGWTTGIHGDLMWDYGDNRVFGSCEGVE